MQKIFRTLLIIAMLITAYLLVLAWQRDYAGTSPVVVNPSPHSTSDSHLVGGVAVNSDLPVVNVPSQQQQTTTQLIEVTTDRYEIKIDPVGGDIVYLALKDHDATKNSNEPFVLFEEGAGRTYVAQSLLGGRDGIDNNERAVYRSPQSRYQLVGDTLTVPLTYDADGVTIQKNYTFSNDYPIKLGHTIVNTSSKDWQGQLFVQLKRDNSKDPGLADKGMMGMATYLGGAWGVPDRSYNKLKFGDFNDQKITQSSQNGWVALLQHYFVSAWAPGNHAPRFFSRSDGGMNYIGYHTDVSVGAGKQLTLEDTLYAGPKVQSQLTQVAEGLDKTVDYGVFWPISKPIFLLLQSIHSFLGNWGWSIIALTLIIKSCLLWISNKSYYSMAKMRLITPRLQKLKEDFGDDKMRMSQEMMRIYKEEKVNPLAGCLPVFLQMPIFLALYWVLVESVELRHAPWILWINDLSSMDPWFVLPIIMGGTMYAQQLLNPQPSDPMQAKVMRLLPIIFTVFMLFFPAGLVLYWTVNNLYSMAQQHIVNKKVEKQFKKRETKVLS